MLTVERFSLNLRITLISKSAFRIMVVHFNMIEMRCKTVRPQGSATGEKPSYEFKRNLASATSLNIFEKGC